MNNDLLSAGLACIGGDVSIIPIDCRTKRPATNLLPKGDDGKGTWKPYQGTIVDEATARRWCAVTKSFAVVGGAVSGGLLILDFDVARFYDAWRQAVGEAAAGLPVQQTGGGGYQVFMRCPEPGGNDKLAWMPVETEETGRTIAIETRGEGGYAVVAPSLHPSGNHYKMLVGSLADIPTIAQAQADELLAAARELNEAPLTRQEQERVEAQAREAHQRRSADGQASIIDPFNRIQTIDAVLVRHGYTKGIGGRYIRPGGKSASVSVNDGHSFHFSSNDPLNDGKVKSGMGVHDAFDLYAHYEHGGDVSKAVKAAAELLGVKPVHKSKSKPGSIAAVETYRPFPVEVLPAVVADYLHQAAKALGCDPAYVALPMLAALASAIGNTRRIRLKASWAEPLVLWCVIVGDSGTLKSPAFDKALYAIRQRQKRAMKDFEKAQAEYLDAMEQFKGDVKAWRQVDASTRGERPDEPQSPICERLLCADITVEALAVLLSNAPRGLLVARDELSGWLASFNQYKAGQGGDVAAWLEMHRAGLLVVDRKMGDKKTIFVSAAAVCIAGGIQPEPLRRCLTPEFFANGLAARLLLAMPPAGAKRWTEADIDGGTMNATAKLFDELLSFQPSQGIDGDPEPTDVELTDEAKVVWVTFYNKHAQEQAELDPELKAAWSKLEGYAARLVLLVHCVRQATGEQVNAWRCDEISMQAGIALAEWFGHEAKRVYAVLGESLDDRNRRLLVESVQVNGGKATVRELMRRSRRFANADELENALNELVQAGVGRWQNPKPGPAGGHPAKVFHLLTKPEAGAVVDAPTVDTTPPGNSATGGIVNCQRVNGEPDSAAVNTAAGRELGEL